MKVQDIEKYNDRASGCLITLVWFWGANTLAALYGSGFAWSEIDFLLMHSMLIWFGISLTITLLCYTAYAVVRSTQARFEAEPPTISVHRNFVTDGVDPEYYR